MVALTVSSEYGYVRIDNVNQTSADYFIKQQVLGVATVSALHLVSLGFKVGGARKAANVPYPYRKFLK